MKALPIDKEFTGQYVRDLHNFFKKILTNSRSIKFSESSCNNALSQLCNELDTAVRTLNRAKEVNQTFSLSPNLLLDIEDHKLKRNDNFNLMLSIGGWVEIKEGVLNRQSFCIAVLCEIIDNLCQEDAEQFRCHPFTTGTHVIRKFHFDIDRTIPEDKCWPRSHLQYGGNFTPEHFAVNEELNYQLFEPLDLPRIPAMPYSLILCMDLALRAFVTSGTNITKEKYWKAMIKENESRWIKPFLLQALEFLDSKSPNETLWDFFSSPITQ